MRGKKKREKSFTLKHNSAGEVVGRDMARKAKPAAH
jgi:hypothetical protein